jgi:anaerobic dimethyl sulfoxide reductase subunit B (iron-sulfur subunit)
MTYAFSFDASACSGCKACQEACKDKNGLPAGILWRRVIEVSGGEWQPKGNAWENSVFAFYLTLACNHCTHPKCAGVCPTDAYTVRPDGIVLLDASKCMGCGYCAWACPYGAPQYDKARGIMTKCDLCYDYLDAGLSPSCVAACPLRVLDCVDMDTLETPKGSRNLWQLPGIEHPFPLPEFSRTEPHLALKLHPGMNIKHVKTVSNREEVLPPGSLDDQSGLVARRELPLVAFTLLTQMAVGMAVVGLVVSPLPFTALLAIGLLLLVGALISFLHLGRKRNAWRSVAHLRKSWLSREILIAGLFTAAWAVTATSQWLRILSPTPWLMAILGLGLIYCMSRVYQLRAVPGWNTWQTPAAFFLATVSLGMLGVRLFLPLPGLIYLMSLALVVELGLALMCRSAMSREAGVLRVVFMVLGILGAVLMAIVPTAVGVWMAPLVLSAVLVEEAVGRWQFYAKRKPFPMGE